VAILCMASVFCVRLGHICAAQCGGTPRAGAPHTSCCGRYCSTVQKDSFVPEWDIPLMTAAHRTAVLELEVNSIYQALIQASPPPARSPAAAKMLGPVRCTGI